MVGLGKLVVKTEVLSKDGSYGKFVAGPLERGFGHTLGNSLRRVLLSSLPGVAVTSVKIDGILHEFSTIPGVKEDVTQIILNLKGLRAKLYSDTPKVLEISAKGPCEVTASSVEADSDVEILKPDMHIATLDEDATLHMYITIRKSTGYVPAELNKLEITDDVETIPIDSIYTPVTKVNYGIESVRVGQKIDYDELTLEVWTNGILPANEAVSIASDIMKSYLDAYSELFNLDESLIFKKDVVQDEPNDFERKFDNILVEDLDFSARALNCLKKININTVSDLAKMSNEELSGIRNMGKKSLEEVKEKLVELGVNKESKN
jgi:DNA-directed RNA polymerase subunit alpha